MKDKLVIRKIYLKDLKEFLSKENLERMEHIPLSNNRIESYLNNPRKWEEKPVLYVGYLDDVLVAYRSVYQDYFFKEDGSIKRVIWISGSWTNENYRKRGISQMILDEVSTDYEQSIFISNYGMSYSLYSKRKDLANYRFLKGQRFYYRLSLAEILPNKKTFFQNKVGLLKTIDKIGNLFLDQRFHFQTKSFSRNITKAEFNEVLANYLAAKNTDSLFMRNQEDFRWILTYPWVKQLEKKEKLDQKYHFSTSAKRFYQGVYVWEYQNEIQGFLWFSLREKRMKIHYHFSNSDKQVNDFADFILHTILKENLAYVMLTDASLIQKLKDKKGYLYSKNWDKGYFAGQKIVEEFPEIQTKEIFMGDGDSIFT